MTKSHNCTWRVLEEKTGRKVPLCYFGGKTISISMQRLCHIPLTANRIRNTRSSWYLILGECQTTDRKECQLPMENEKIKDYSCSKTQSKLVKENINPCLTKENDRALNNCDLKCKQAHSKCRDDICVGAINRLGMGF